MNTLARKGPNPQRERDWTSSCREQSSFLFLNRYLSIEAPHVVLSRFTQAPVMVPDDYVSGPREARQVPSAWWVAAAACWLLHVLTAISRDIESSSAGVEALRDDALL